jgi:hypothetical protein
MAYSRVAAIGFLRRRSSRRIPASYLASNLKMGALARRSAADGRTSDKYRYVVGITFDRCHVGKAHTLHHVLELRMTVLSLLCARSALSQSSLAQTRRLTQFAALGSSSYISLGTGL